MKRVVKDTIDYLDEAMGIEMNIRAIPSRHLPVFITKQYDFYTLELGKQKFLGVVLRDASLFQVTNLEKHRRHFPIQGGHGSFVLMAARLEGFVRKRLIEVKVPFIVPRVQLYWPELGLEYRKRNQEKTVEKAKDSFQPTTQAVLIGILNGLLYPPFRPKELAKKLEYSLMSMTRALDQMEAVGLGRSLKKGRERFFTPLEKRLLWEKAAAFLNSPVRDTVRLLARDMPDEAKILAGESALARGSALVAPQTNIYAVGREWGKLLQKKVIPHLTVDEPDTCAVQIWRYNPALFAKGGMVDVFSLYLSLKGEPDERVGLALEQTLKENL